MNRTAAPNGGDIDELLREFYRRERPDPWPAAPDVRSRMTGIRRVAPGGRGVGARWALAVSLGVFALMGLVVARHMPAPVGGLNLSVDDGKATLPGTLQGR